MEQLYALGVTCIEFVQEWFSDSAWYFELVNNLSDPHNVTEILFPLMSIFDSVFGAQLLLCMSFGGWLTTLMKWWFQEDRPYWWVHETTYYSHAGRPSLRQTSQTCETGPGSPSGHSESAATLILLTLMWFKHVMHDRKCYVYWWKYLMYPLSVLAMGSVMVSRMYIATHFPHQCLFGALIGSFLAPFLCIYVSDPYIWCYGFYSHIKPHQAIPWHVAGSIAVGVISIMAYLCLVFCGQDPLWTVRMAYRYCQSPEHVHITTSQIFSLVHCTGSLLGLALCVTPDITLYRHDTKNRSITIAFLATIIIVYSFQHIQGHFGEPTSYGFYATHFLASTLKPILYIRAIPNLAMWPYKNTKEKIF